MIPDPGPPPFLETPRDGAADTLRIIGGALVAVSALMPWEGGDYALRETPVALVTEIWRELVYELGRGDIADAGLAILGLIGVVTPYLLAIGAGVNSGVGLAAGESSEKWLAIASAVTTYPAVLLLLPVTAIAVLDGGGYRDLAVPLGFHLVGSALLIATIVGAIRRWRSPALLLQFGALACWLLLLIMGLVIAILYTHGPAQIGAGYWFALTGGAALVWGTGRAVWRDAPMLIPPPDLPTPPPPRTYT